jgi:pimeloyl-ACP methyl ester carboxylesterase
MNSQSRPTVPTTLYLPRSEGRIGYDVDGAGPLLVLVPGMGDLRQTYRFLAPVLRQSGFRVACTDLRGHGDSDASFGSYGDADTAGDIAALIEQLGGPAVIVGNSMAAGAAVIVAAEHPELVSGLVLVGPFVRNGETSAIKLALFRLMMARPWAAVAWKSYLPKLYSGQRPSDFDAYRRQVVASLHRPGYTKAFSLTTRTDHDAAEACLGGVSAPVTVVMGENDPDFADPAGEAAWIAERLQATVTMVPEAGHYPHSQQPDITAAAVLSFVTSVTIPAITP